ncbi:hypothetical protein ABT354_11110 [Streptomyces sp. NPDC000594]|uniref:hypothetical protein n=1 Tax=Streptomyces sp. NPDC000594 TaxID=3154261 RepID=UPI00333297F3
MGKGSTPREIQHYQEREDGRTGCWIWNCGSPATRWIDMERYGIRRWLSEAFCDGHGEWPVRDSSHTYRLRLIKENDSK